MKKIYNISLKLKTPLHINAGTGGDGRRVYVSDKYGAYIPATVLKGIFRNTMEMNIKAIDPEYKCTQKEKADQPCGCILCRLFGKAGFAQSRIVMDNLLPEKKDKEEIRTNVSINRFTRRGRDKALVTSNVVSAADEPVYSGRMTVYFTPSLLKYETALIKSLEMINSIGSGKSRGLGLAEIGVKEI